MRCIDCDKLITQGQGEPTRCVSCHETYQASEITWLMAENARLQARADQLAADLAAMTTRHREYADALLLAQQQCDQLEADVLSLSHPVCQQLLADKRRAQAALRMVEWVTMKTDVSRRCPWCERIEPNHFPDCPRQAALETTPTAGEIRPETNLPELSHPRRCYWP